MTTRIKQRNSDLDKVCFTVPGISDYLESKEKIMSCVASTATLTERDYKKVRLASVLAGKKISHFLAVAAIEAAEKVLDMNIAKYKVKAKRKPLPVMEDLPRARVY